MTKQHYLSASVIIAVLMFVAVKLLELGIK